MTDYSKVILKPGKEQSLLRLHPWVFSGAIREIEGKPREGEVVEVLSFERRFLALGHYQIGSIAVRIISFRPAVVDEAFWFRKLQNAFNLRESLNLTSNTETNVYRLVHGEGDGMPGLIIDFYNGILVMQAHSVGMYLIRQQLASAVIKIYDKRVKAIYDKSENTVPFKANLGASNETLYGTVEPVQVRENGYLFEVDVTTGQKTGFFIDQRESRKLLSTYCNNNSVLNLFCYTGGFSMYALGGGARQVHSVDSSAQAISLLEKNIVTNGLNPECHNAQVADAISFLTGKKDMYDVIVLDPPAFAKHQDALNNALQGYKRLNIKAIEQVRNGGVLFTFSCSQVVSRENFRKAVFAASANTGRHVRILHQLTQPADHPVSIYHPEGEYLKGLVLQVTDD
jgi:23S rRNA (cytosine1962-C5)-methyltransferase